MLAKRLWSCRRIDLSVGETTDIPCTVYQREQGWRSGESTCLPPMWPEFKSRRRRHMWVEFVVGSPPCSERFFSGYSGFPLSSKTNISKFQFDRESGRQRTTMWMCYLQIVIYLFYLFFYSKNDSLHCGKCTFKLLTWTLEKRRN